MPIATYALPQNGSFVAEPQYGGYGGYAKGGASYTAAPQYASYQPGAEYSTYGSATPPYSYGQNYTSTPAPYAQSYQQQQYSMPSTASFTQYEQPIQQTYQMPNQASFTYEPHTQPYSYQQQYAATQPSYQQQYAATQSSYALPQQSFTAYPQAANYPGMGDMPQFQFYKETPATMGADWKPAGLTNQAPAEPGHLQHQQQQHQQVKPTGPVNHAAPGPGEAKGPINKPHNSTSKRPPQAAKKSKKKGCVCGL